jgi:uncharacterized membrane protein
MMRGKSMGTASQGLDEPQFNWSSQEVTSTGWLVGWPVGFGWLLASWLSYICHRTFWLQQVGWLANLMNVNGNGLVKPGGDQHWLVGWPVGFGWLLASWLSYICHWTFWLQ